MEQEQVKEGSSTEMIMELNKEPAMEQEIIIEASSKRYYATGAKLIPLDDGVKEQIMQAVSARNPGENIIGLYGPDRRLTLAVNIAKRRAQRDQLFQHIVTTFVSYKPHIRKIQSQIGAAIGLSFDDDDGDDDPPCFVFLAKNNRMSMAERASLLCAKMKELETVLVVLVLYELHGSLDLGMVGIPSAKDHKGCKILLTSSSHDLLSNEMKAHVLIEVW